VRFFSALPQLLSQVFSCDICDNRNQKSVTRIDLCCSVRLRSCCESCIAVTLGQRALNG
jgi:hypothetical protein